VHTQAIRSVPGIEITVCERMDRARQLTILIVVTWMRSPIGDQAKAEIVGAPDQELRQVDFRKVAERPGSGREFTCTRLRDQLSQCRRDIPWAAESNSG
jgi:hypothetical protein